MNEKVYLAKYSFRQSVDTWSFAWDDKVKDDVKNNRWCRCHHPFVWHKESTICGGISTFGDGSARDSMCDCEEYMPKDNLQYIEWRYNKKETANGSL